MRVYSLKKKYEKAADLRDRIKALNQIQEKQSINISYIGDADVISIKKKNFKACIQVFYFRGGNNLGGRYYFPRHEENEKEENILQSFLGQYYSDKIVTKLILINKKIPEKNLLTNALNSIIVKIYGDGIAILSFIVNSSIYFILYMFYSSFLS